MTDIPADAQHRTLTGWQLVAIVAAALIAIGSFGPWVTLGIVNANGLDGSNDGWITLLAAALSAVVLWRLYTGHVESTPFMLGLLAIIAGGVGIYDAQRIAGTKTEVLGSTISPDVGWGLGVVIAGSVILLIAAFKLRRTTNGLAPGV